MIFYFSGTGNSYYAAAKIAAGTGDRVFDIADVLNTGFPSGGNPDVTGFVFPVYYSGLPEIVKRFAESRMLQKNLGTYVFCVITCGACADASDKMLEKALGTGVDYSYSLVMPDNYVVVYNPSSRERAIEKLADAAEQLPGICNDINERKIVHRSSLAGSVKTAVMYPLYKMFRVTKPFYANEKCTGCGMCERNCPDGAIEIKNGKPEWVKSKCQHCTACINNCPVDAIQFTKKTEERNRYSTEKLMK